MSPKPSRRSRRSPSEQEGGPGGFVPLPTSGVHLGHSERQASAPQGRPGRSVDQAKLTLPDWPPRGEDATPVTSHGEMRAGRSQAWALGGGRPRGRPGSGRVSASTLVSPGQPCGRSWGRLVLGDGGSAVPTRSCSTQGPQRRSASFVTGLESSLSFLSSWSLGKLGKGCVSMT